MAEIQLRNISKRWGSFVGVDNFDLIIADRELLAEAAKTCLGDRNTPPASRAN